MAGEHVRMASSLTINTVVKRYGSQTTLKGVSLDVKPGEFMTLVGPSGCGKSTLLRIIAGLLAQDEGQVSVDGQPIDTLSPAARDMAMVFQSYALYPHMSVGENIALPLQTRDLPLPARLLGRAWPFHGVEKRAIREEVARVADQVELGHLLNRRPAALSGGQRQRVALARAIIRKPRIFLMDEPLSNLDARLRVQMRAEITALHQRLGATFIYVTHDQTEAMTMSSRVALMMEGEIVQCDSPAKLYADPQDLRVAQFIGSPGMNVIGADDLTLWGDAGALLAADYHNPVQFALRPEHIHAGTPKTPDALVTRLRIERLEDLGHSGLVFGADVQSGAKVTLRLAPGAAQRMDLSSGLLPVHADPADALVFDAMGKRLTGRRASPKARSGALLHV